MMEIQNFNTQLVNNNNDLTILEYVKKINHDIFHYDCVDFIDEFMDLVERDDFCIGLDMVKKHGISSLTGGSHDDYVLSLRNDSENGNQIAYFLKPEIFKFLLMSSQNTRKYAMYFIFLEKSIFHYNKYQLQFKDKKDSTN